MVYLYTVIFLSTLQLLSIGYFFEKKIFKLNFKIEKIGIYGLTGLFTLGLISLLVNFLFPINRLLNTLLLLTPIILILFNFTIFFKKEIIFSALLISFISFITICLSNIYTPDGGLYHLPYVRLLNEHKIILGITNINFTLGQASFFQYISSTYNNFLFGENGIIIPLVQIYSFIIFSLVYYLISSKINSYSYFLIFLITSFCLIRINRYSEFGNDAPAHLLYFFLIFLIMKILHSNKFSEYDYLYTSIISIFAFLTKPTLIFIFLFNIFLLFRFKFYNFYKLKQTYVLLLLLFIYFIKNIMISGCILYPIKITCFKNLPWYSTNIEYHGNSERIHDQGQAWTKGYPDQPKPQKSFKDYNKGFYWISIWYKNHGFVILKKFTPVFLFLTLIIILNIFFHRRNPNEKNCINNIKEKDIFYLLGITGISTVYWFFNFPVLRYGLGYVGGFAIILFSIFIKNKIFIHLKILKNLLLILCFIVVFKNFYRIVENYNLEYSQYPWAKIYGFSDSENIKDDLLKRSKDGKFYFFSPKKSILCFYNKSPCTHFNSQKILSEIEITEFYYFKSFKIRNKL